MTLHHLEDLEQSGSNTRRTRVSIQESNTVNLPFPKVLQYSQNKVSAPFLNYEAIPGGAEPGAWETGARELENGAPGNESVGQESGLRAQVQGAWDQGVHHSHWSLTILFCCQNFSRFNMSSFLCDCLCHFLRQTNSSAGWFSQPNPGAAPGWIKFFPGSLDASRGAPQTWNSTPTQSHDPPFIVSTHPGASRGGASAHAAHRAVTEAWFTLDASISLRNNVMALLQLSLTASNGFHCDAAQDVSDVTATQHPDKGVVRFAHHIPRKRLWWMFIASGFHQNVPLCSGAPGVKLAWCAG